ncbi:MAG: hypothetical protein U1F10_07755 [Burkholderiales bacterium]
MRITGGCHCGNIGYVLDWEPDPAQIPARACGCTFCVKHGGVWTSHPAARLAVTVGNPADVEPYRFGTRTAVFHVCRRCGVVPVVTCRVDDREYAVVNVNTFADVDAGRLARTPASFDGEPESARLARRQRNWIADVTFAQR